MKKKAIEVWYELEPSCNLSCKFCYNFWRGTQLTPPRKLNTADTIRSLKVLLDSVDCKKISISGGEPLLRKDLFDILTFINNYSIPLVLTTNSILLDEHKIKNLVELGVKTFQVPFHSTKKEIHDLLTGINSWQKTLQSLVLLKEQGVSLALVFVATRLNLPELPGVLEFCSLMKIENIIFNRFIPGGLGLRYQQFLGVPNENELLDILSAANQKARLLNLKIHLGVPIKISPEIREELDCVTIASCSVDVGQSSWTIDCEGNIRRCNHSKESIGNLLTGGMDLLLTELNRTSTRGSEIHSCHFLQPNLIQLKPKSKKF